MGDILEDLEMVDKSNHKEVMSIGFLNYPDQASEQMKIDFDNKFDVVISGDGPLTPAVQIIDFISDKTQQN